MKFIYIQLLNLIFLVNLNAQGTEGVYIPRDIRTAYEKGCRSFDGRPGPEYFQNNVDYEIKAEVDIENWKIYGSEKIYFHNKSGRNLKFIVIKNYQDVFKKGAVRARPIDPADAGNEVRYTGLVVNDREFDPDDPGSYFARTTTNIVLPCKTPDQGTSVIQIDWELNIPKKTHQRFGAIDTGSFFMAYWFPQVAVFDDINSWDVYDFNNMNEMYNEFGKYDVQITVPEGFIVWATGVLKNPSEVLDKKYYKRYKESLQSSDPVGIICENDDPVKEPVTKKGSNTWKFEAELVNDFAFGVSDHHLWAASYFKQDKKSGVHLHTAYLPGSENFKKVPAYLPWMMQQLTDSILGYPFPFPSMTVFNGLDGMEYPMIVNDSEMDSHGGTYFLTTHEIAHSYFPFLVGINQRRHGWMDEGLITLLGVETHTRKLDEYNFRDTYLEWYPLVAGTQQDLPPMVNSVFIADLVYQEHEYVRPSTAFWILRDILGEELFRQCLVEFIERWKYKHPTPYDLFFTINDVSGEDFNWFFQPWFLEFAYPDLAIADVVDSESEQVVIIKNIGGMPFPALLEIHNEDEIVDRIKIDARVWASGNRLYKLEIPKNISHTGFVLNTELYPDVDNRNNVWNLEFEH